MVDPKKEYELLMRYLQGGAIKHEPAGAAGPEFKEEWTAAPQPLQSATVIYPKQNLNQPVAHAIPYKVRVPSVKIKRLKPLSLNAKVRIGIAVFALALLSYLLWKGFEFYRLSVDSIYNKTYVPFVSGETPAQNNSVEYYYAQKNYVAVTLLSKKQQQLSYKENLLTGLAYLHRDNYTKAIQWLEPISVNYKSPYRLQAEFYLALAYLKNEDYDRSLERMEHISLNPVHPYYNRISDQLKSDVKMLKWK